MILKICGLKDPEHASIADAADYVGFVMGSPRSHRNISSRQYWRCVSRLDHARSVIVTASPDPLVIRDLDRLGADVIQLHGRARGHKDGLETPYALAGTPSDPPVDPHAKYVVLDTPSRDGYGGSGIPWTWQPVPPLPCPVLIAGGISSKNLSLAMQQTGAQGIDISSSLEVRGVKSQELILELLSEVGRT